MSSRHIHSRGFWQSALKSARFPGIKKEEKQVTPFLLTRRASTPTSLKDRFACILLRMQTSNDWTARFENVLDFLVMALTINAVYIYTYVILLSCKGKFSNFLLHCQFGGVNR